jgi:hypothetical protein
VLIGVPVVLNFGFMFAFITLLNSNINSRLTAFRAEMQAGFDALALQIAHLEEKR